MKWATTCHPIGKIILFPGQPSKLGLQTWTLQCARLGCRCKLNRRRHSNSQSKAGFRKEVGESGLIVSDLSGNSDQSKTHLQEKGVQKIVAAAALGSFVR